MIFLQLFKLFNIFQFERGDYIFYLKNEGYDPISEVLAYLKFNHPRLDEQILKKHCKWDSSNRINLL